MKTFHDFSVKGIDGKEKPLSGFQGKTVMVVNVASKCGLTPQYAALENLYRRYKDRGFVILGLPCNQFAWQEPGTEEEIKSFCSTRYDVTFPMTCKIEVNGKGKHPLYEWLTGEKSVFPGKITWNFEKFLIGKSGDVLKRFSPKTVPDSPEIISEIEKALS